MFGGAGWLVGIVAVIFIAVRISRDNPKHALSTSWGCFREPTDACLDMLAHTDELDQLPLKRSSFNAFFREFVAPVFRECSYGKEEFDVADGWHGSTRLVTYRGQALKVGLRAKVTNDGVAFQGPVKSLLFSIWGLKYGGQNPEAILKGCERDGQSLGRLGFEGVTIPDAAQPVFLTWADMAVERRKALENRAKRVP